MTPGLVLAVALGAALGAPARFAVERRTAATWPWGTLVVNGLGSALLGLLVGVTSVRPSTSAIVLALVGTGFCGALTTFGGFAAQLLDLATEPRADPGSARAWRSLAYAAASVAGCLAIAALGYALSQWLLGH